MPFFYYLIAIAIGYLIGSIPFGYILGRLQGVDVTQFASGRTGGTNVFRAMGPRFGVITGVLDFLKGALAVILVRTLFGDELAAAMAGGFAVVGHNWSIYLKLRGGAGGSTGAGALMALNPLAGLFLLPVFLIVLFGLRIASVATLTVAVGAIGILTGFYLLRLPTLLGFPTPAAHIAFAIVAAIAIVWSLRPNIARLLAGTERRIQLRKP